MKFASVFNCTLSYLIVDINPSMVLILKSTTFTSLYGQISLENDDWD